MATWDAQEWLTGLMGLSVGDLTVRSIDRYGSAETQVRYEQGGEAVVRLTVTGPVREMLGQGIAPPAEVARPEVAEILMAHYQQEDAVKVA